MMNEELLIRFLTKTCTNEELLGLEKWISVDRANADWLFEMERIWSLKDELRYSDRKEIEDAYQRFVKAGLQPASKKRRLNREWLKYAAAIAIICLLAANIYQAFKGKTSDKITMNTVEVPVGQRVAITLADGTKVWLNSGSILSYPSKFDLKNRIVRLDGEGYFEVTADKEHPFEINTSALKIKALGTKFNVQAYPDEDIAVSLLEGKLHLQTDSQSVSMSANELATWSKVSGLVLHKSEAVQYAAQWTSGELLFVDERLADIAKVLEKHFGVKIIINTAGLADERFTCRTQTGATLEKILNLLKSTRKVNYTIKEQTVFFY